MLVCVPRFCVHSVITGPTYSCGTKILLAITGSRFLDQSRVRQARRVRYLLDAAVAQLYLVDHRRRGGDQIHAVLALEPFLHDVHVQQTRKPQRKPKPSACEVSGS